MTLSRMRKSLLLASLLLASACVKAPVSDDVTLKRADFSDLQGWDSDNLAAASGAFSKSCKRILKKPAQARFGALKEAGTYGDWQPLCTRFNVLAENKADNAALRYFFENEFVPFKVSAGRNDKGLFTGYYEASLKGSKVRQGPFQTPLYGRPNDLVMVHLGEFRPSLKGQRIAGRVNARGTLKPYEAREDIVQGKWPHNDHVIVWVDSPIDAFFVQIQGSGVIEMIDGSVMRIGYAGQNGHPYYAIGRELIKREALTKETVSMQSIRTWLEDNPSEAEEIMNTNKSYVFFRELEGEGPLGGEGVALTAGRSLAIDRTLLPYGAPIWLESEPPIEGGEGISGQGLKRLMIAQDTGGAIRGAVRGDVFWGYGSQAEWNAGHMKSDGRYWILLPKGLYEINGL